MGYLETRIINAKQHLTAQLNGWEGWGIANFKEKLSITTPKKSYQTASFGKQNFRLEKEILKTVRIEQTAVL